MGTINVTRFKRRSEQPRKTAKNGEPKRADVTTNVTPMVTLVHLTRGKEIADPSLRVKSVGKNNFAPLAPGHGNCPIPKTKSLPPGWHWCRHEKAVVTDTGVIVPVVEQELVGTEEGRAALRVLRAWEQRKNLGPAGKSIAFTACGRLA
jgi:hypothetical protein